MPLIERVQGSILVNPGSPTDRRWHPHFGVGIVTVDSSGIQPELMLFGDPEHLDSIRFDTEEE
jgi:predicted phosphodiesterase